MVRRLTSQELINILDSDVWEELKIRFCKMYIKKEDTSIQFHGKENAEILKGLGFSVVKCHWDRFTQEYPYYLGHDEKMLDYANCEK